VESGDDALVESVIRDPNTAALTNVDRALVRFAKKLTREPGAMSEADLDELRAQGLGDRAILDAVQVVALFNYYNRVADGLGVSVDDDG
tara:strand:+ start:169 stop:435 length:267 start_codon:yes stop_codon:yes gene_type:complete